MQRPSRLKNIDRIIDANINRAKEGLRVCEEIPRFILSNPSLTADFKRIRHKIDTIVKKLFVPVDLLKSRKSQEDVGRGIYINELKRKDLADVFFANVQRVKESIRVLEEFTKLKNKNYAIQFKKIRYDLYEIEKKAAGSIAALRHHR